MQTRCVILLAATIFAVYLPIAWYLDRHYVPVEVPAGAVAVLGNISHGVDGRFAYLGLIPLDQFTGPVKLYENDRPLGPADAQFNDIRKLGMGRYMLWHGVGFAFSATDNSDPRTNGRHYWIVR
jgi:hypothetical protein